jgi:ABC-2 type transport system ATP-binding protein
VVAGYNEAHDAVADSLGPQSVEVLELNLEDAFIEYTRGPRRAPPRFFKEDADG